MSYTWDEIQRDWLAATDAQVPKETVAAMVAAFNAAERILGRGLVESHRAGPGHVISGAMPTLSVMDLGLRLLSLDGATNTARLIDKLKARDSSAYARELTAVWLLRSGPGNVEVDVEPDADVSGRLKRPDFRVRVPGDPWLYVEVTQPDIADAESEWEARREPLFALMAIKKRFAIEIYLRRDPSEEDIQRVLARATELSSRDEKLIEEVGTIGFIILNHTEPGVVVPTTLPGEPSCPVLGAVRAIRGPMEPERQVVIRSAYSDERAEKFLQREAKQLPTDAPGLVMIEMARARGGPKQWGPLLERRLQPNINTRVGGICMFHSGVETVPEGSAFIHRVTLLANPHARFPLPAWVPTALQRFPEWAAGAPVEST